MSALPFVLSPEAATHIRKQLRDAAECPYIKGMLPILCFAFNSRSYDMDGRTVEWCPIGFFQIGWYRPEQLSGHCLDEIDIDGEMIYAFDDTLKRLAGKSLVLETVDVGYPDPADRPKNLLRAR